jgi:hypothetical protein
MINLVSTVIQNSFPHVHETSAGKLAPLHPIYLLHLHRKPRIAFGLRFVAQTRPVYICLICSFCSSGRDFASGFLQIPPHDGHPCPWLTVGAINPRNGLSPSRSRACRAHTQEQYRWQAVLLIEKEVWVIRMLHLVVLSPSTILCPPVLFVLYLNLNFFNFLKEQPIHLLYFCSLQRNSL